MHCSSINDPDRALGQPFMLNEYGNKASEVPYTITFVSALGTEMVLLSGAFMKTCCFYYVELKAYQRLINAPALRTFPSAKPHSSVS